MTIPQWTLLGFAAWTLALLMATVGVYRWGSILFAKAAIASFRSDALEGAGWYQRGTRAHANCIENLPVFGAIVYLISATGLQGPMVDALCIAILAARIVQSCVHISHDQTNAFVAVRF
ncbi:MAG TPA: MAPEG family protein, partial [Povalibacter sp.]